MITMTSSFAPTSPPRSEPKPLAEESPSKRKKVEITKVIKALIKSLEGKLPFETPPNEWTKPQRAELTQFCEDKVRTAAMSAVVYVTKRRKTKAWMDVTAEKMESLILSRLRSQVAKKQNCVQRVKHNLSQFENRMKSRTPWLIRDIAEGHKFTVECDSIPYEVSILQVQGDSKTHSQMVLLTSSGFGVDKTTGKQVQFWMNARAVPMRASDKAVVKRHRYKKDAEEQECLLGEVEKNAPQIAFTPRTAAIKKEPPSLSPQSSTSTPPSSSRTKKQQGVVHGGMKSPPPSKVRSPPTAKKQKTLLEDWRPVHDIMSSQEEGEDDDADDDEEESQQEEALLSELQTVALLSKTARLSDENKVDWSEVPEEEEDAEQRRGESAALREQIAKLAQRTLPLRSH